MTEKKSVEDIMNLLVDRAYHILNNRYIRANYVRKVDNDNDYPKELPKHYDSLDQTRFDEIIDMVKPLLTSVQQAKKINAESAKDIIKQLGKGKITLQEAHESIKLIDSMVNTEKNIDELKIKKHINSMFLPGEKKAIS
jgi:hypothetical protein